MFYKSTFSKISEYDTPIKKNIHSSPKHAKGIVNSDEKNNIMSVMELMFLTYIKRLKNNIELYDTIII